MNKYAIYILVIIAVLGSVSGYSYNKGSEHTQNAADADQLIAVEAALEDYKKSVKASIEAGDNYRKDKIKLEESNAKLEKRIQTYIDNATSDSNCLDADGVQLFNDISEDGSSSDISRTTNGMLNGTPFVTGRVGRRYLEESAGYICPIHRLQKTS